MVIDFHTHIFPAKIAKTAIPQLAAGAGLTPTTNGTLEDLRRTAKSAGVDINVVQNIATNPNQNINVNNFAISLIDEPGIIPFGSVHPDFRNWKQELERLRDNGIKGIKLHPDYQEFFVDEERIMPIYEKIAELGFILLFHAGVDIGLPPPTHCTPDRLLTVAKRFPELKIVAAHLGGYLMQDDSFRYLVGTDIYFDTSFSIQKIDKALLIKMINEHGADKFLFGSDSPWSDAKADVEYLRNLPLTDEEKDKIFYKNALSIASDFGSMKYNKIACNP